MTARDQIKICRQCEQREVEVIDGWTSGFCSYCNDRMAERERERREWDYYHRDERQ